MTVCTRFDIAYVSTQLSQHCSAPTVRHWNGVTHLIRYLHGSRDLRLRYGGLGGDASPTLQGFCDADYAGDRVDRGSITGHMFLLNGGPVSWTSSKQRCVATSTTEAEYIALCDASKQGQWLRALLKELRRPEFIGDNSVCHILSDISLYHHRRKPDGTPADRAHRCAIPLHTTAHLLWKDGCVVCAISGSEGRRAHKAVGTTGVQEVHRRLVKLRW